MSELSPKVSNSQTAAKSSAFAFMAIATQLFGSSIVFFIIARMVSISIEDFGRLTYAFALAQMIAIFFEYGLGPYLSKSIASAAIDKHQERAAYGLHLCLMAVGFILFALVVSCLGLDSLNRDVCMWVGASVFTTTSLRFFYGYYQGKEQHNTELLSTGTEMLIQVCVIILVFNANLDVLGVAQAYFVGRIIAWFASYAIFAWRQYLMIPALDRQFWQRVLQDALPFNLTFVAAFAITSLDTILLQILASDDPDYQVGLYQAAIRLILIPAVLATVVTRVFLPQLSRMGGDTISHLRHLNNILLLLGLFAGIFCFTHADYLTTLAYGSDYQEVGGIAALLALSLALRFGAAFNLYFTLRDQMWMRFSFACIALACLIVFNYLLVPQFGVMGTVYASILTHLVYWLPVVVVMQKQEKDPILGWRWYYAIPVAGLYWLFLWSTQHLGFWWAALFSVPITIIAVAFSLHSNIRATLINDLLGRGVQ
jgi:O-antigen/teichoic acid export membrane protein